ncbi:MAG: DUF3352 domain-containing protein [candidate division KSB1 bacterium]|nr:DUF3352 domain-containing protein [candidate division KSB1 bacterium]MDZ7365589.1 DUF3352 domain-containing protein [candidate division KSB1 bacterium]MDZ7403691.1 DUF3352 domain-containing protein [candidate division KSB1 bacterium]
MKKQYYYWIAAALVLMGIAVGLFLWKGRHLTGIKAEATITEEAQEPKIALRELLPVKTEEEKFFEAVRHLTGAVFDSLSDEQKLDVLLRLADDTEATNRLLAVQKLGAIETTDNKRIEKLIVKLQDESPWVIEEAVIMLRKLRATEAAAPLRQLLTDLRKQPQIEYMPFANTAMMAVHGRVQANGEKNEFNFQLTSFAESAIPQPLELNEREEIALFILPGFQWCLALPNFKTNWRKLQNSAFGKQLVQLQAWEDFKTAAPFNRFFALQEKLNVGLGLLGGDMNLLIDPLGDEVYLAAYPGDHLLLVTPANLKAKAVNATLTALGKARSGDVAIEKQIYRGESIFHVYLNNQNASLFRYAVVDGYLVIADDEKMLVRAVASYKDKDESSLAYQSAFRQSLPQAGDVSFLLAYVDPQKFFDIDKRRQTSQTLMATVARALNEITGEQFSAPPDSLSAPSPKAVARAIDAKTLQFIPANTIFGGATTAIAPPAFWHYVSTRRAEKEAIKSFETRSNLNLGRDLISKLDNQLFYFFAGIDATGPRFFWRQLFGVRLREQKGVEPCCKRLLKYLYSPEDEIQAEDYEGVRIHYVQGPTTFEPNFAIVDGYLLMAFDRATLKAAIDAGRQRTDSIEQNYTFVTTRSRINAPENSLAYFNSEIFLNNYRSYLAAYDRMTNLFDQYDLERRVDPLFELLKATVEIAAGKFSAEGNGEMVWGMK